MRKRLLVIAFTVAVLGAAGCNPRGETRTLEEVVQGAKDRFTQVYRTGTGGQVSDSLKEVVDTLNSLQGAATGTMPKSYEAIGRALSDLTLHAGYTSRPALGELAEQWLGLTAPVEAPSTRLLLSRTYGVLASELEGVGFALSEGGVG